MITLIWSPHFKRQLEKFISKHPELRNVIKEKMRVFIEDQYNPALRNHKLTGKLSGLRAIVIAYNCRIVFEVQSENEVLLVDIGSHDDVY